MNQHLIRDFLFGLFLIYTHTRRRRRKNERENNEIWSRWILFCFLIDIRWWSCVCFLSVMN